MQEAVKPAVEEAHRRPRELHCPRCGLRLQLLSRSAAGYAVGYSVEKWVEQCTRSQLDSPLACLMSAAAEHETC